MYKLLRLVITSLLFVIIFSIYASLIINVSAANVFYVHIYGNDSSDCLTPLTSCATINVALAKASAGDTILVGMGTYAEVVQVNKNIFLSGGWDDTYTTRVGFAIIDGTGLLQGMVVAEETTATVEYFVFQNSSIGGNGGTIDNYGALTLDHCILQDNQGRGITNIYSTALTMVYTTIRNNGLGGIYSYQESGLLTIINSTISDNGGDSGGPGVYVASRQSAIIVNSTISGNDHDGGDGGGIRYSGSQGYSLVLINDTITGNRATYSGGGIYYHETYGGQVLMSNNIVYGNIAQTGFDCFGTITSQGYNLIGDSAGCAFDSTTGDQLDVDPLIGPLQDNGGPTYTHWLYEGSPAIDGGNPAGCLDQNGDPQTIDQRGYTRPLDGDGDGINNCDIGAYEADPNNLPPNPATNWYVTPEGSDSYNCLSPAKPCATINGAVGKAAAGDTVYVSIGTYTGGGNEVVLIDKKLNLSGGWNYDFTAQTSLSTIDGEYKHRCITINPEINVSIENFLIQNGLVYFYMYGMGGGIFIDGYSKVTLTDSIVYANAVSSNDLRSLSDVNGGGIGTNVNASLTLNRSLVIGNTALNKGGGIYSSGTLTLIDSGVSYNTAGEGGGISGASDSQIVLNHSIVTRNASISSLINAGGGGINGFNSTLTMKDSSVTYNTAAGDGGGIICTTMTMENSTISDNLAAYGGGISSWYTVEIRNSAILHNTATTGSGGGIYSRGDLVLINTTLAYNKAQSPYTGEANGGAVLIAGGYVEASNATISMNTAEDYGGGIWNQSNAVNLRNSILAGNLAGYGYDCLGTISSAGYNLIGDTYGCDFTPSTGDLTDVDPQLGPLYGYPRTFALQTISPAIDGGNPGGCVDHSSNPIDVDQIGTVRPMDGNKDGNFICDIGAFEYDPDHPPQWRFLPMLRK